MFLQTQVNGELAHPRRPHAQSMLRQSLVLGRQVVGAAVDLVQHVRAILQRHVQTRVELRERFRRQIRTEQDAAQQKGVQSFLPLEHRCGCLVMEL